MTPDRYRECLDLLGMSASDLARMLKCSDRMTYRWASGKIDIPPGIAYWLEAWVAVRQAHPDPLPPDDWHAGPAQAVAQR